MRGQSIFEGIAFTEIGREKHETPVIPNYLYKNAMGVSMMPADEYNFRNDRYIPIIYQAQPLQDPVKITRKPAYSHIVRRKAGGMGHVPETSLATVERRERIEQLRKDVKRQC